MNRRAHWKRYWTETGVIPRWQLFAVYVLIFAAGFIGFLTLRGAVDKSNKATRANHVLAVQAARQAATTKRLTATIQKQRKDLCQDQNARRRSTIKRLNLLTKQLPPSAERSLRRRSTIQLINALAPPRNCAAITP